MTRTIEVFVDLVTIAYHEGRNVRHLQDDGHAGLEKYDLLRNLARNRQSAWDQLQPLRDAARKCASAETAEEVFRDRFKVSLEDLSSLRTLRDGDSAVSVRMVSEILEAGTTGLARLLGKSTQRLPSGLIRGRDASEKAQEERHFDLGAIQPPVPERPTEVHTSEGPAAEPTPDPACCRSAGETH